MAGGPRKGSSIARRCDTLARFRPPATVGAGLSQPCFSLELSAMGASRDFGGTAAVVHEAPGFRTTTFNSPIAGFGVRCRKPGVAWLVGYRFSTSHAGRVHPTGANFNLVKRRELSPFNDRESTRICRFSPAANNLCFPIGVTLTPVCASSTEGNRFGLSAPDKQVCQKPRMTPHLPSRAAQNAQ